MRLGARIYSILHGNASVAASVADRITPSIMPQGQAIPAIVYTIVLNEPVNTLSGPSTLRHALVQIDCYARTYSDVQFLADAVETAFVGTGVQTNRRDLYDDETSLHRASIDMSIWGGDQ